MSNGRENPQYTVTAGIPRWVWGILIAALVLGPLIEFVMTERPKLEGKASPELTLTDLKGEKVALHDYRGKTVMLNFWASWCGPCVEEFPSLAKLEKRLSSRPFALLLANVDESAAEARQGIDLSDLPGRVLFGAKFADLHRYNVRAIPVTLVIDTQGTIRQSYVGGYDWNSEPLIREVERWINSP